MAFPYYWQHCERPRAISTVHFRFLLTLSVKEDHLCSLKQTHLSAWARANAERSALLIASLPLGAVVTDVFLEPVRRVHFDEQNRVVFSER